MLDLQAFFKMSYGLYVLSSAFDGKQNGCIVNTVTQVTAEPPKVAVAVSKQNLTTSLIERSGLFNAVALTEEATMDLIGRFGFRSGREEDKPWMYSSSVSRPMGSMKSWCRSFSGKRTILVSMEGQYRGPTPSMVPSYRGERSRLARMTAWVAALV